MNSVILLLTFIASTEGYNISMRHKRNDENILEVRYNHQGRVTSAVLREVSDSTLVGYLVRVWHLRNNGEWIRGQRAYLDDRVRPTFYHGVNSFSALTYYPNHQTLHGVIDEKFYVEDLPLDNAGNPDLVERFLRPIPNELGQTMNTRNKRGMDQKRKSTGVAGCSAKKPKSDDPKKKLYPEIFVVVDVPQERVDITRSDKYERAMMYVLAYWNAIDMLFRNLKRTDIKINIAEILVTQKRNLDGSSLVHPDNIRGVDPHLYIRKNRALDDIGTYFYNTQIVERKYYDLLIWMTSATLLDEDVWHDGDEALHTMNKVYTGTSSIPTDCGGMRRDESRSHKISNRAIVMYDNEFAQYHTAARELAHLMFVPDDYSDVLHGDHQHSNCLPPNPTIQSSGIMDPTNRRLEQYLYWSHCSEMHFERYSKSKSCCCLLNYPIRTYGMSDPPHYLTTKTQCECYKMEAFESNNYKATNCHEPLECKNRKGRSVKIGLPLDGTLCVSDGQDAESYCSYAECL